MVNTLYLCALFSFARGGSIHGGPFETQHVLSPNSLKAEAELEGDGAEAELEGDGVRQGNDLSAFHVNYSKFHETLAAGADPREICSQYNGDPKGCSDWGCKYYEYGAGLCFPTLTDWHQLQYIHCRKNSHCGPNGYCHKHALNLKKAITGNSYCRPKQGAAYNCSGDVECGYKLTCRNQYLFRLASRSWNMCKENCSSNKSEDECLRYANHHWPPLCYWEGKNNNKRGNCKPYDWATKAMQPNFATKIARKITH